MSDSPAKPDLPPLTVLGVMSGTSLDGADSVTVRLRRTGGRLRWDVLGRAAHAYPQELGARLQRALKPETSDVVLLTELHQEVGRFYAQVVSAAQELHSIDLVALSGQTVYHIPRVEPERGWRVKSTLQLGEATVVTERCRVATVSDFRQSDLSAGGEGAPLVSFPDSLLYAEAGVARVVVNLGGIANVTYLPADGDPRGVLAFDTGPSTCLLNEAAARFAGEPFDDGGRLALAGTVDAAALERLLADPYFALRPPKTTGREHFHLDAALARGWPGVAPAGAEAGQRAAGGAVAGAGLGAEAGAAEGTAASAGLGQAPSLPDIMATLAELTVRSVVAGIQGHLGHLGVDEVLVAGGGARNPALLEGLRRGLSAPVRGFAELGFDEKDRETLAMAVMGYMCVHGEPNVLPSAAGASWPVVAGKVARPWAGRSG